MEQIKDEMLRENARESKRSRIKSGRFSHQLAKSGGHGKFYGSQKQIGQGSTNFPLPCFNKDKGFNPKVQEGFLKLFQDVSNMEEITMVNVWLVLMYVIGAASPIIIPRSVEVVVLFFKDKEFKVQKSKEVLNAPIISMLYILGIYGRFFEYRH